MIIGSALVAIGTIALLNTKEKSVAVATDDTYSLNIFDRLYSMSTKNKVCSSLELNPLSGQGILCSETFRLSRQQSNEHVLMIAPSGAGKSRRFMMPNVKALEDCSLVITDPCGEIHKTCKTNKATYILNPFSQDTVGYDPLLNCKNEFEVRKMARTILMNGSKSARNGSSTNQQDWIEMAIPLFTAYLLSCHHTKKYNFSEVIQNVCTMDIMTKEEYEQRIRKEKYDSIFGEIVNGESNSAKVELESFLQVMGAKQTLSSIRSVLNTCLQVFLDEGLRNIFSKQNLDFCKLREEESILYVQIPERHAEYFAPFTATLMSQLIDNLLDNDGLQVYMMFDEFTNIGVLPDMTKLLSTARKHKLSIVAAIQSLTQLTRVYGDIEGKELSELFKTILACNGLKETAEYVSNLLGTSEIYSGKSHRTKPLMTADEVRRMKKDEILIICNNKRPVLDNMLSPVF